MLAIQKQPKYFSRFMAMPNGVHAWVVFELVERDGHLVAKAIYAEAVDINKVPKQNIYALPGIKSPVEFVPVQFYPAKIFHSFLRDLSFVISQPTRAPSIF